MRFWGLRAIGSKCVCVCVRVCLWSCRLGVVQRVGAHQFLLAFLPRCLPKTQGCHHGPYASLLRSIGFSWCSLYCCSRQLFILERAKFLNSCLKACGSITSIVGEVFPLEFPSFYACLPILSVFCWPLFPLNSGRSCSTSQFVPPPYPFHHPHCFDSALESVSGWAVAAWAQLAHQDQIPTHDTVDLLAILSVFCSVFGTVVSEACNPCFVSVCLFVSQTFCVLLC